MANYFKQMSKETLKARAWKAVKSQLKGTLKDHALRETSKQLCYNIVENFIKDLDGESSFDWNTLDPFAIQNSIDSCSDMNGY